MRALRSSLLLTTFALAACGDDPSTPPDRPGDDDDDDDDLTSDTGAPPTGCSDPLAIVPPTGIERAVAGDAVSFAFAAAVVDPCDGAPRSDAMRVTLVEDATGAVLAEGGATDGAFDVALAQEARSLVYPFRSEWACRLSSVRVRLEATDLGLSSDTLVPVTDRAEDTACSPFGEVRYERLDLGVEALGTLTGGAGLGQAFVRAPLDLDLGIEVAVATDGSVDVVDEDSPGDSLARIRATRTWAPYGDLRATWFLDRSIRAVSVADPSSDLWRLTLGFQNWSTRDVTTTRPGGLARTAPDAGYVTGDSFAADLVVADQEAVGTVYVVADFLDAPQVTFGVPADTTAWITGIDGADRAPTQFYVDLRVLVIGAPMHEHASCGGTECGVVAIFELPLAPGGHDLLDADTLVIGSPGSHAGAALARSSLCPEGFVAPDHVAPDGGRGAAVFEVSGRGVVPFDELSALTGEPGNGAVDGLECWGSDGTGASFGAVRARRVRTDTGEWEGAQYLVSIGRSGSLAERALQRFAGSGAMADGAWVGHVDGEDRVFLLPELLDR